MRLVRAFRLARLFGVLVFAGLLSTPSAQAQTERKFDKPVLVTSAGQALDAFTVKTLLARAGVDVNYDPKATVAALDGIKTVIVAVGVSNKGFGQAGITAESEMARTKAILEAAKAKGIGVVCVHIGGAERRKGLSVQFIELVAPVSDQILVTRDGNTDNYFEQVSKSSKIPLLVIDQSLEVGKALANLMTST